MEDVRKFKENKTVNVIIAESKEQVYQFIRYQWGSNDRQTKIKNRCRKYFEELKRIRKEKGAE